MDTSMPTAASEPTATLAPTVTPTATTVELAQAAPSATVVEAAPAPAEPEEGAEFPWARLFVLLVIAAAATGWMAPRRRP